MSYEGQIEYAGVYDGRHGILAKYAPKHRVASRRNVSNEEPNHLVLRIAHLLELTLRSNLRGTKPSLSLVCCSHTRMKVLRGERSRTFRLRAAARSASRVSAAPALCLLSGHSQST
jgi:hypothetical protein